MVDRTARVRRLVIRANLLPRPRETLHVFGADLDADVLRRIAVAIAIVAFVSGVGYAVERVRAGRLGAAVDEADAAVVARRPERERARRLALDVARYEEFARRAQRYANSGSQAALTVARLGNRIPAGVWLDSLAHDPAGYALAGGGASIEAVGRTVFALGDAFPERRIALERVETDAAVGVRFSARIASGPPP